MSAYSTLILSRASLVRFYRLGEASGTNAVDAKGNADGTYAGTPTLGVTGLLTGDADTAVTFTGSNRMSAGNLAGVQLSTGTLEAWIKTSSPGASFRGIIGKNSAFFFGTNASVLGAYDFTANAFRTTGVNIADNVRRHIAMTFQSGVTNGTKIYINGALVLTTTTTVSNQSNALFIATNSSGSQDFAGTIDEAAIYNAVLSEAELLAHYNIGSNPQSQAPRTMHQVRMRAA